MNTSNYIQSTQNPKIKHLLQLSQKSSERRKEGVFIVEGRRELQHCIDAGFEVDTLFYCPSLSDKHGYDAGSELADAGNVEARQRYEVSPEVYARIAYRGDTEGIIATVKTPERKLADLKLSDSPLIVVLESVEKPGNLGAILRSADAAGADAVVVCNPLTDIYNPNVIRSSIGAVFTVPCIACSSEECIEWLKAEKISILTAQLQDSLPYYATDMKSPVAIVMGTESTGLTPLWRTAADAHIRIPMLGKLDSLNVSVSAAILLFEAVRQRQED